MSPQDGARKAWQEPMVWLMAGIPVATVAAGLATLAIAVGSGAVDNVPAAVTRVAQTQTLQSAVDETASRLGYRGVLRIDRRAGPWRVSVRTTPPELAAAPLNVLFAHPQFAGQDVSIRIDGAEAALPAALGFTPQQVVVTDAAGRWRLVGSYSAQSAIALTPAVTGR